MLLLIGRYLSSNKFLLFLIIILNLRDFLEHMHTMEYKRLPLEQVYSKSLLKQCNDIMEMIEFDHQSSTHNIANHLASNAGSSRKTQIFRRKDDDGKIIAKSYPKNANFIQRLSFPLNSDTLKREFLMRANNFDLQFCPHESIDRFVYFLSNMSGHNETYVWLLLLTNAQLILHSHLEEQGFPVPRSYGLCGYTLYQEHVGDTLEVFKNANFDIKLRIAKQLLEAALKFTNGFRDYHIYITDLTADNLVYNVERDKLYFIDLNTAYIVDSRSVLFRENVDKHELIECDNCFAFVPDRLCSYSVSDLNLLSACLFLREDLKGDRTKGFLKPIPSEITVKYPNLEWLLDNCVSGVEGDLTGTIQEMSRFRSTLTLIELIGEILNDF
ncbi:uncharacterized protein LOC101461301 [Ceratitis capitata]|uniref:uncharacterized protein LOC101461301 n=1 Tax=Ceratitis capitata TaxID=7213 RepID=UPI000329F407|nr:uncharacterized protein LOC101461301 [Ceratitis capitata]